MKQILHLEGKNVELFHDIHDLLPRQFDACFHPCHGHGQQGVVRVAIQPVVGQRAHLPGTELDVVGRVVLRRWRKARHDLPDAVATMLTAVVAHQHQPCPDGVFLVHKLDEAFLRARHSLPLCASCANIENVVFGYHVFFFYYNFDNKQTTKTTDLIKRLSLLSFSCHGCCLSIISFSLSAENVRNPSLSKSQ